MSAAFNSWAQEFIAKMRECPPAELTWRGTKLRNMSVEDLQALVKTLMLRDLEAREKLHAHDLAAALARFKPPPRPWWAFWQ